MISRRRFAQQEKTSPTLRPSRGFTLIEVLIDIFVITSVFAALVGSFLIVLQTVNAGQVRSLAAATANQQMEYLRNLPYDSLATINGPILPQGNIPDSQTVSRSGSSLTVNTSISYVDDPFDGCVIVLSGGGSYQCTDGGISTQQDLVPVDYKRLVVEVFEKDKPILLTKLVSSAAAKAAETQSNTGMLLVVITDANGLPLSGATVTITHTVLGISLTGTTNSQGYLFVAGLTPDNQNGYHIVATKDGYSTDFTTERTSQNPNQVQPDVDVNAQQVTTQNLAIDRLATFAVRIYDTQGAPLPGVTVTATSTKTTQFNPEVPKHVYTQASDTTGLATFSNIEWDSYSLTVPTGYYLVVTAPYQKVAVQPEVTTNASLYLSASPNWPQIISVNPISGVVNQTVAIVIEGANFPGSTVVSLRQTSQPEIFLLPVTTEVNPNQKTINVSFNLTNTPAGSWDILVTTSSQTAIQPSGFTVVAQ